MRRVTVGLTSGAFLVLSACAPRRQAAPPIAPNPFAYEAKSATCVVTPLKVGPDGSLSVAMKMRSDGGSCAVSLQKSDGGNYASFGVAPEPEHGKAFIYNYNGHTYIIYSARTAFSGSDGFGVTLISGHKQPRRQLKVNVEVDATGVTQKAAPSPAPTKTSVAHPAAKKNVKRALRRRPRQASS